MYIEETTASMLLNAEGNTDDWPTDLAERGKLLQRASRRIDQLAFNNEWEVPYSPRYLNGYLNDGKTGSSRTVKIPTALSVQVALLALWYAQNPDGFYNQSPVGALCRQLSDLPLSIQTGLWRFLADEVKIDSDDYLTSVQLERPQAGPLYNEEVAPAAVPAQPAQSGQAAPDGTLLSVGINGSVLTFTRLNEADLVIQLPGADLTNGWQSGGATFRYVAADSTLYVLEQLVDPTTITADTTGVKAIEAFDV